MRTSLRSQWIFFKIGPDVFFFKRSFCGGRKETRTITKLVILKAHQITVKCRVKVVLKCSSSICGCFIVLDTLSCDDFIHSIKNMRCFHSYSTNLNKILSNTIILKVQQVTLLSKTFYSLHFRPAPYCSQHLQTRIQTSDNHSKEDLKHHCWSTVLQVGNWAMPRAPPTFLGGNLMTAGDWFCSRINSAYDNPPNHGISPYASFTHPTSHASLQGARRCH